MRVAVNNWKDTVAVLAYVLFCLILLLSPTEDNTHDGRALKARSRTVMVFVRSSLF
jgi:hypothetical protein